MILKYPTGSMILGSEGQMSRLELGLGLQKHISGDRVAGVSLHSIE